MRTGWTELFMTLVDCVRLSPEGYHIRRCRAAFFGRAVNHQDLHGSPDSLISKGRRQGEKIPRKKQRIFGVLSCDLCSVYAGIRNLMHLHKQRYLRIFFVLFRFRPCARVSGGFSWWPVPESS